MSEESLGFACAFGEDELSFGGNAGLTGKLEGGEFAGTVDIDREGKEREHVRHQVFRDHVNRATIGLFRVACAMLGCGLLAYGWHLLTPLLWHFLSDTQQVRLQTMLAPAVLSSALTGYVNRRIQ